MNNSRLGGVDPDGPSLARAYDYVLGGASNFAVDRLLADEIVAIVPGYQRFARLNRAFLRRAVLYLRECGIRQFLDLGSGLPTVGPAHEILHRGDPAGRVVYVDSDPVVAESCRRSVGDDHRVGVINGDLLDVAGILDHPVTAATLDLSAPVGLLLVAVLHCIPDDDDAAAVVAAYHDGLPPGSILAASHASGDSLDATTTRAAVQRFAAAGIDVVSRSRRQFAEILGPWAPDAEGIVATDRWRPETISVEPAESALGYAVTATSSKRVVASRDECS